MPRRNCCPRTSSAATVVVLAALAAASSSSTSPRSVEAFAPALSNFASAPLTVPPATRRKNGAPTTRLRAFDPSFIHDLPTMVNAAASTMGGAEHAASALVNHGADALGAAADGITTSLGSVMDTTSTLLSHGAAEHHAHHIPEYDASNPVEVFLHSPTPWSVVVMLSIVALLVTWEEFVESLREGLPAALMSVVDSMLAEMGGLGFIGLFLQLFVTGGVLGVFVGELSEQFLGEEEVLLETFEFLHTVFFQVGIGFFAICGLTVFAVLNRIKELGKISELALDTDGDGEVSLEEMADALHVEAMVVDENGDGVLDEEEITNALRSAKKLTVREEVQLGDEERGAEALVVRERLIRNLGLPDDFKVEYYFERVFAHELEEIVEFSPLTWLPLIPLIALDDTVDLTHGVISAASANAADSSGWFLATPWFFIPALSAQVICIVWGIFNLWKMTSIKLMLEPTLVRDGTQDGPACLLPPRYEDPLLLKNFNSSPGIFGWIEGFLPKAPAENDHQRLFGVPGARGPRLYRDSIKFHTWLCVAQIIFFGGQIVVRDAWALANPAINIGCPEYVVPEVWIFTLFVLSSAAQLALAPTTFLNYCFSSNIETMVNTKMMAQAEKDSMEAAMKEAEEMKLAAEEEVLGLRVESNMGTTAAAEADVIKKKLAEERRKRKKKAQEEEDKKKDPIADKMIADAEAKAKAKLAAKKAEKVEREKEKAEREKEAARVTTATKVEAVNGEGPESKESSDEHMTEMGFD